MPKKPKQLEKPYKGDLKVPIRFEALPVMAGVSTILFPKNEAQIEQERKEFAEKEKQLFHQVTAEFDRKMDLLLEHYGVSKDRPQKWYLLSVLLAKNHVPGFRLEEKGTAGAPAEWNFLTDKLLLWEVADLIYSSKPGEGRTVSWACKELVKRPYWAGRSVKAKSLENRYAKIGKEEIPADPDLRKTFLEHLRKLLSDGDIQKTLRKKKASQ